jgi:hypothetical protein
MSIRRGAVPTCPPSLLSDPAVKITWIDQVPAGTVLLGTRMVPVVAVSPEHLSSSAVQTEAETEILCALASKCGIELVHHPEKILLGGGVYVEVDGATPDRSVVVEAYARQGKLKGAQPKKIAQDILKLALLKRESGRKRTRAVIAFASQEARDSISGWIQQAAKSFDIELIVVEIPEQLRDQICAAQHRQIMVNLDHVADDIGLSDQP